MGLGLAWLEYKCHVEGFFRPQKPFLHMDYSDSRCCEMVQEYVPMPESGQAFPSSGSSKSTSLNILFCFAQNSRTPSLSRDFRILMTLCHSKKSKGDPEVTSFRRKVQYENQDRIFNLIPLKSN